MVADLQTIFQYFTEKSCKTNMLPPRANVIKLFTMAPRTNKVCPRKTFHPYLMFASKVGAYQGKLFQVLHSWAETLCKAGKACQGQTL